MTGCAFILSILFFGIGLVVLFAPEAAPAGAVNRMVASGPRPAPQASAFRPNTVSSTGSPGGGSMDLTLQKLDWIKVGQRVKVPHPVKGELMAHIQGRILYTELWQQVRGPQSPWVPTGNQFAAFWLDGEMLLMNWQSRFYLLDENEALTDADIARDFAPHARKFAQSDQTANVIFAYPPASWHIDDIGKFRVESIEGSVLSTRAGAVGRFVHASGDSGRALVLEDYEGGGQDTVWIGYQLKEEDIKPA
jgi:hypothetical protein